MAASGQEKAIQRAAEQEQKRQQQEEARQSMLMSILTQEAKERLNRISLVKPDKARVVENRIIQMAKSGALKGEQVSDKRLTDLLANMADAGTTGATKVVMKRRTYDDSDDDDDDDDL